MASEIEIYQGVIEELKQAKASVERIAKIVGEGAAILRDWKTAMVSNAPGGIGFPPEIALRRQAGIDCREWPTGEQIARALSQWHQCKARVESAYHAIPEGQRQVVVAPRSAI